MRLSGYKRIWLMLVTMLSLSAAAQGISPANLECESKSNPVGLSETNPRQDVAILLIARGQYQAGCEIQVASLLQLLTNKNKGDLWDTGQVAMNQTRGHRCRQILPDHYCMARPEPTAHKFYQ